MISAITSFDSGNQCRFDIAGTVTHSHRDFFPKILGYPSAGIQGGELAARNAAVDAQFKWLDEYISNGGPDVSTTYPHLRDLMNIVANVGPLVPGRAPPTRRGHYFFVPKEQNFTDKAVNRPPDLCMIHADLNHLDIAPTYADVRVPFKVRPYDVGRTAGTEEDDAASEEDAVEWEEDDTDSENGNARRKIPLEVLIASQVRAIFSAQWDRRFVLYITITFPTFRVWHFDRCGAVGSNAFHIIEERERFVWLIHRLSTMSPVELGFDPSFLSLGIFESREIFHYDLQRTEEPYRSRCSRNAVQFGVPCGSQH